MIEAMLTTTDNPWSPFTHWDEWFAWDVTAGYHTPSYLARVVVTSDELSESDQNLAIEQAIDEIVEDNITGVYKKVTRVVEPTVYQSDSEFETLEI
jgi:hypothetical protein